MKFRNQFLLDLRTWRPKRLETHNKSTDTFNLGSDSSIFPFIDKRENGTFERRGTPRFFFTCRNY